MIAELRTERLVLRTWRDDDLSSFAAMNADPVVMEHFPSVPSREESDAMARRIRETAEERGWGLWAVEVIGGPSFAGFVGLLPQTFEAHFTPCVEVAWRLARETWNRGYATEAAKASLAYGFETLRLDEIVSMTAVANVRSRRVMEKIGMTRDPRDDFDHPKVEEGHRLRRHVLYRVRRG